MDPEPTKGTLPQGVQRLPQAETTRELSGWTPTALAFHEVAKHVNTDLVEARRARMRDIRNGSERYVSLSVRMEIAAAVLAAGGSFRQAGRACGRSAAAVQGWNEQSRFRERVQELQAIVSQQISGRILREFERRTREDQLDKLEVLDLTRIFDRVVDRTPAALERKAAEAGEDEDAKYINITNQILNIDTSGQGADFPIYSDEDLQLPGGDS